MSRPTSASLHAAGFRPAGPGKMVRVDTLTAPESPSARPAIRVPKTRTPNSTESRWLASARARWPLVEIKYEAVSFRLKSGASYRPDFTGWVENRLIWAAEVKGSHKLHSHARAALAWKTAANEFPAWMWIWAERQNGEFAEVKILPREEAIA